MPIRMVEDDSNNQEQFNPSDDNSQSSSSGGNGIGSFLFLLPFLGGLLKRPKLLLLIAALAAAYFFIVKPMLSGSSHHNTGGITTGANFDEKKYDGTEVFEPLDNSGNTNVPLPERVSLERFAPDRKNQGEQGSCVAWSSAYAARTIMEAASAGVDPNSIAFSPAYLYNQIKMANCQGSLLPDAMQTMLKDGAVPLKLFPYNPNDCERQPDGQMRSFAAQYRTRGFQRLTKSGDDHAVDFVAIKQNLAAGAPVVIGMMVPSSFMQPMMGKKVWQPDADDNPDHGTMGGHAMCVIGYDDNLAGGAFQVMNSWGSEWGENGLGWIRYADFMKFDKEAYGLYPLPAKDAALQKKFACKIGLVEAGTKNFIQLKPKSNFEFETENAIPKGTKFKMYINNELECYTYIFGKDTNSTSYTLFPYTPKHSPFCGITGVRLFPKDYSMQADNIGNKDYMAIVISKQPLDYKALNAKITANPSADYANKVINAVGALALTNVPFTSDGKTMNFSTVAPSDNKAVVCIVEVNKK